MRTRVGPLLAELHAHTTWSDGDLSLRELVNLHGQNGFDVLCVTDHVVRSDDPLPGEALGVLPDAYPAYLAAIAAETEQALALYGLLVIPGLELTYNDLDPMAAAHAIAVRLRRHVSVDEGIDGAIETARAAGAAIIAAHPYDAEDESTLRQTQRFAHDRELTALAHRCELFNRTELVAWVAEAGLPAVACGDVHTPDHVFGWKTLLPCAPDEEAIVAYLRSRRPTYLARLERDERRLAA